MSAACTPPMRAWPSSTRATSTRAGRKESASGWCARRDRRVRSGARRRRCSSRRDDKVYRHPTFYTIPDEVKTPDDRPRRPVPLRTAAGDDESRPRPAARRVGAAMRRRWRKTWRWPTSRSTWSGRRGSSSTYAGEIEGRGRDADALAFLRDALEFRNACWRSSRMATSARPSCASSCSMRGSSSSIEALVAARPMRASPRSPPRR